MQQRRIIKHIEPRQVGWTEFRNGLTHTVYTATIEDGEQARAMLDEWWNQVWPVVQARCECERRSL